MLSLSFLIQESALFSSLPNIFPLAAVFFPLTSLRGFLSFLSLTTLAFLAFFFFLLSSSLSSPPSLLLLSEALLSYLTDGSGETRQKREVTRPGKKGDFSEGGQEERKTADGERQEKKGENDDDDVTHSSAMSSSSSPGLKDSSKM